MKIALTFPTCNRANKVKRLIESFYGQYDQSRFQISMWMGLDSTEHQLQKYLQLKEEFPQVNIHYITLPQPWEGLGVAFNYIIKQTLSEDKSIEVVSMFGDDMFFEGTAQKVFEEIEQFFNTKTGHDKLGCISFNCGNHRPNQIAINGFVHRNWIECFDMFIPPAFFGDYSDNWLTDIASHINRYRYVTDIPVRHVHGTSMGTEFDQRVAIKIKYDQSRGDAWRVYHDEQRHYGALILKANKYMRDHAVTAVLGKTNKCIAFSLWGDNPKYTHGAIENSRLAPVIYPGWTCRFYVDIDTVPAGIIQMLRTNGCQVIEKRQGNWNSMFWRFYAAEDCDVMISRDCDSRLTVREKAAVDEWLNSDKDFHIMRDHPYHGARILGGMWGVRNGLLKNIGDLINSYFQSIRNGNYWQVDQVFLTQYVYPMVKDISCVHDEFFNFEPQRKKFPMDRVDGDHIGSVYNEVGQRITRV